MKNEGIVSAIVGSTFFAIPYLGLAVPFAPALAIGVAAFGATELIFKGSKKIDSLKETNKPLYDRLESASKDNSYILSMIPKIDDDEVKQDLKEIHETTFRIINVIAKNPEKESSISNFFDYYLPVLVKIVGRYDEIENQNLSSKDSKKFIKSTALMIKEVNDAFRNILSSLYQAEIVDADAEMKVFNQMLKADGFNDKDLLVKEDEDE